MKKFFTLLVSVTLFASAFAQYKTGGDNNYGNKGKDYGYNDGYKKDNNRHNNDYSFGARERDIQIAQINREYDRKIMDVKNRYFIPRYRKQQMIRRINDQRNDEIRMVYAKFSDRHNHYDDHDSWRH